MLEVLKGYQFKTVRELKRLLKKLNYGIHHKHIESIYNDTKQKQLIDLKSYDIERLEDQFHNFEILFKKLYPKQKYIVNYSIIIHYLLKKNGYSCYKNILLPRNHHKSLKKFIDIIKKY